MSVDNRIELDPEHCCSMPAILLLAIFLNSFFVHSAVRLLAVDIWLFVMTGWLGCGPGFHDKSCVGRARPTRLGLYRRTSPAPDEPHWSSAINDGTLRNQP